MVSDRRLSGLPEAVVTMFRAVRLAAEARNSEHGDGTEGIAGRDRGKNGYGGKGTEWTSWPVGQNEPVGQNGLVGQHGIEPVDRRHSEATTRSRCM